MVFLVVMYGYESWTVKKAVQFSSIQLLSHVWLFATPWIAAYQAPQSIGFSRQEYWSGVPLPSPQWLYRPLLLWITIINCILLFFRDLKNVNLNVCLFSGIVNQSVQSLSCVWLFATPWIAAYQAPPSMGFSRQEYWSGVPLPSPILQISWPHNIIRIN